MDAYVLRLARIYYCDPIDTCYVANNLYFIQYSDDAKFTLFIIVCGFERGISKGKSIYSRM